MPFTFRRVVRRVAARPRLRRIGMVACVVAMLGARADAADYYVKNGGNDTANGLSLATAWATLGHAANVVNPGDTVHVQDGNYQGFYLDRSGAAGSPVTFVADGPNVRITQDNGITPDGINVEGADYVVIEGFIVDGRTRAGIRVALSSFVTVRNCHTGYNGRWGIFTGFADDFTVEFNETHHSQAEHGIYVSNSGDRPVIRGNVTHDNYANGIHMNGDESQGGDGTISGALVERNVIYGNGAGGGSGINMDGVIDSVVRNNLLYDNHASGISLYRIDGATGSTGNLVVNNTIVNASNGRWCVNITDGSSGNHVLNNILYNYHSFRGAITIDSASRPGFISDYNSVMDRFSLDDGNTVIGLAAWQGAGYDTHSFLAAPPALFVAPASDFHLKPGSPAIDAGTSTEAPASDLEGNPRPVGGGVDCGAYESQLANCGDGTVDPGEQCGEPGLACSDPCRSCSACTCVLDPPVCGDGRVCAGETCEIDADCAGGDLCQGCQCVHPAVCTSGIAVAKPGLKMRADTFKLLFRGEAIVPKPWQAIDPVANGVRIVIDALSGPGTLDVTIPGGALVDGVGWKRNRAGTTWTYIDPAGVYAGITRVVVRDRSSVTDGLVRWVAKGKADSSLVLPDVDAVRSAFVAGAPGECAALLWNAPSGLRPRCEGDATRLLCR